MIFFTSHYIKPREQPNTYILPTPPINFRRIRFINLALTPKGKPNSLKDYNNFNKVNTDNILSFINYTTTDK